MLEAFGKGASEDIEAAKDLIYTAMTYDPNTPQDSGPALTTPPESPVPRSKASQCCYAVCYLEQLFSCEDAFLT